MISLTRWATFSVEESQFTQPSLNESGQPMDIEITAVLLHDFISKSRVQKAIADKRLEPSL